MKQKNNKIHLVKDDTRDKFSTKEKKLSNINPTRKREYGIIIIDNTGLCIMKNYQTIQKQNLQLIPIVYL